MALSQVQCLDDSHVNWRSSESKPEFFYSEEQRLALEALVSKGPEAFYKVLKEENIRDFLSELELKKIMASLETYDPGSEYIPRHGGGDSNGDCTSQGGEGELAPSLEYWPQRSDRSIPQLDLGWPETVAYRGVTRAMVYMQPPIDGQAHIKEVVRKMIVQAQKVVAVVMDMFTDVDIFKDLLDAGFKRKVGVYIIVDETNAKYFLQMCERAQMHAGHLKVRRTPRAWHRAVGGYRQARLFKGALAQKFMFVDGDRAMCGSYSFTWSAARTDRNLISVLSGQVVEAFDKQFQELYLMSRGLSLKSIPMDEEPEPEPFTLPSVMPVTPANAVVKRLINPKYALVKAKSADQISKMSSKRQADATRPRTVGDELGRQLLDELGDPLPLALGAAPLDLRLQPRSRLLRSHGRSPRGAAAAAAVRDGELEGCAARAQGAERREQRPLAGRLGTAGDDGGGGGTQLSARYSEVKAAGGREGYSPPRRPPGQGNGGRAPTEGRARNVCLHQSPLPCQCRG
uniref:Family with sequence similarity 83 member G n=1 Tax=Chelonoidis abingdonii TaxID=106734 RepID=A0A8C0J8M4_CHEAB